MLRITYTLYLIPLYLLPCCMVSCSTRDSNKPGSTTTTTITANDSVFSNEQLKLGTELYTNNCAMCHGPDLRGTEGGTALIGERFITKWKDQSLAALFTVTKSTMPKSNPKSLDDESYSALVALMLNANGFAPG